MIVTKNRQSLTFESALFLLIYNTKVLLTLKLFILTFLEIAS